MRVGRDKEMIDYPDLYYLPSWGTLYAEKEKGEFVYYKLENEYGSILYPYVKRETPALYNGEVYYDIITPFGFNGPYIKPVSQDTKERLLESFEEDFNKYCIENKIVAEYIRFSPWLKNYEDFKAYYDIKFHSQVIDIDLSANDLLAQCSTMRKRSIKHAIKKGVEISFDFEGSSVEGLYELYQNTFTIHGINEYYQYTPSFLKKHFEALKGHVVIANAFYGIRLISSAMFVYDSENIHYHIAGNDYEYTNLNGNSLLLYRIMEWGKAHGMQCLHLSGGKNLESLIQFKKSFTKQEGVNYYVGSRIRQRDVYDRLVQSIGKSSLEYFPAYRG